MNLSALDFCASPTFRMIRLTGKTCHTARSNRRTTPSTRLATGDIVFAQTGATTGKSFLVQDPPDAVFASYLIRLRLIDKKLLPEFVSLFFQTDDYWKAIRDGSAGGVQGGFNATKLGALSLLVPPLPEQRRIVGILDAAFAGLNFAKVIQEAQATLHASPKLPEGKVEAAKC